MGTRHFFKGISKIAFLLPCTSQAKERGDVLEILLPLYKTAYIFLDNK